MTNETPAGLMTHRTLVRRIRWVASPLCRQITLRALLPRGDEDSRGNPAGQSSFRD
jgi:hypothetical protein